MKIIKETIRQNLLPVLIIFLVTCLVFFKFFLKGYYPIPGDLLVSFYFPWYSGGWTGYDPWTTHKEMLGSDSVRQIYPWKEFAFEQIKKGKSPLWNPYTFSGQPLAANFQSGIFYPFNIVYFIFNPKLAWALLVMLQPLLGGIFTFMAARSFKISKIGSVFSAIAFIFSSYQITWMELATVSHSYACLPLSIWAINKFFTKPKFRFLLTLTLSLSLSILAGHPQTAIYVFIGVFLFWAYKSFESKSNLVKNLTLISGAFLTAFMLSAIQLIPTYDFYKKSPISLPFSAEVFDRAIFPYKNLVTFFASDFFGHPANNNFWSKTYGDFTPYFGVIPLIFALWAVYSLWKNRLVKFAAFSSLFFIIAAGKGPITWFIKTFHVPLLNSTTPSRFISLTIFFLIILAGIGLDDFLKNYKESSFPNKLIKFLFPILITYILFWIFAIFGIFFLQPKDTWQINLAVTKRNLILPTLMFLSVFGFSLSLKYVKFTRNLKALVIIGLFTATLIGGFYFSNKFLPFAPTKYIFPERYLFNWLQKNAGIDRFYGGGTAHIDFNFPTHYQVFAVEGYDTLRFQRYAQLLAAGLSGKVPASYLRSDAVVDNLENGYRKRLFEILGVKYLIDKEDNPKTGADWHYERFTGDDIEGYWQGGKFQVYRRKHVLPRIFQTTNYFVAQNDAEIIDKIFNPNFDLQTLILEKEPSLKIEPLHQEPIIPQVVKYEPSEVSIKTNLNNNSLLYLSDVYDPDWQATIDGQKAEIFRTDYALRSVAVPRGQHIVEFKYRTNSFRLGMYVSVASLVLLGLISIFTLQKRKF